MRKGGFGRQQVMYVPFPRRESKRKEQFVPSEPSVNARKRGGELFSERGRNVNLFGHALVPPPSLFLLYIPGFATK